MNRPETQLAIARQQLMPDDGRARASRSKRRCTLKPDYLPAALTLRAWVRKNARKASRRSKNT